jgi:hypothetical protein
MSLNEMMQPRALQFLKHETPLDDGQAEAFRDSLMRGFVAILGRPGSDKSYLGVKLAENILASRPDAKPILVATLTNHALDQFLADLRDVEVANLLCIASGSKEEQWTDEFI